MIGSCKTHAILGSQCNELLEYIQNVWVQIGWEEKCFQCAAVLLDLFVVLRMELKTKQLKILTDCKTKECPSISIYRKENLLQSTNCPSIPVRVEILAIRIASYQMLRQNHNETLKNDQKETLLIDIGCFQFLFHLFDHFFGGLLTNFDLLSLVCCFILRIVRWWFDTWQFVLCFGQFSSYRSVEIDLPSVNQS